MPASCPMIHDIGEPSDGICCRDVTSPINELDGQSNSSRGERSDTKYVAPQQHPQRESLVCALQHSPCCASSTDDSPFFDHDMPTMRSSSSSEGLPHTGRLNWEGSVESNEVGGMGGSSRVHTVPAGKPFCVIYPTSLDTERTCTRPRSSSEPATFLV